MRLVQRVVAVLIVVIVAWMGVNGAAALDAAPGSASIQDYTYDRHHHADQRTHQAYERGPPSAAYPDTVTPATDDPWSHGASARSPLAAILTDTTYDHAARSAQFDSGRPTTLTVIGARQGDLRRVQGASVAAKSAIGFAEGLGKSALTPNRLQHGTKNLTKAGVLPAWSGKNSPGIIERAFTPILEHPRATFDHSLGGTSVRGFLGDIDGTQVAVFVYKEGPYQGQVASSFVPSPNQLAIWGIG